MRAVSLLWALTSAQAGKIGPRACFPIQLIFIFGVGFALLLPVFSGLDGVLYSMPVSDILTFILAVVMIRSTYKSLAA